MSVRMPLWVRVWCVCTIIYAYLCEFCFHSVSMMSHPNCNFNRSGNCLSVDQTIVVSFDSSHPLLPIYVGQMHLYDNYIHRIHHYNCLIIDTENPPALHGRIESTTDTRNEHHKKQHRNGNLLTWWWSIYDADYIRGHSCTNVICYCSVLPYIREAFTCRRERIPLQDIYLYMIYMVIVQWRCLGAPAAESVICVILSYICDGFLVVKCGC